MIDNRKRVLLNRIKKECFFASHGTCPGCGQEQDLFAVSNRFLDVIEITALCERCGKKIMIPDVPISRSIGIVNAIWNYTNDGLRIVSVHDFDYEDGVHCLICQSGVAKNSHHFWENSITVYVRPLCGFCHGVLKGKVTPFTDWNTQVDLVVNFRHLRKREVQR